MKHRLALCPLLLIAVALLATASCGTAPAPTPTEPPPTAAPTEAAPELLILTSPAFGSMEMIPAKYSRRAEDLSPPLEWGDPPPGTESFALLVISDPMPDGGGNWVQWILYNIPAEARALPESITPDPDGKLPDGSQHFENSWGELKYGGPNPPHVSTYKYYFTLYALDTKLDLDAVEEALRQAGTLPWIGPGKEVFLRAVEGHVLAQGELVGKYKEP